MTAMISDSSLGARRGTTPRERPARGEIARGRAAERKIIGDLLRHAEQGVGGVALVDGEPGIGKSLLLRDAVSEAAEHGFPWRWERRTSLARRSTLSRIPHPDEHAATVVAAFLPDVLRYRLGQPARYAPGTGNGRGLHDDAFGTTLSLLAGHQLGVTASPYPVVPAFPHLAPPGHEDIPALADLLGLRGHAAQQPTN